MTGTVPDGSTFHDRLVVPGTPDPPPRFFDRFVFNAHPTDAVTPSVVLGCGIYPGADTVDGFAIVVSPQEQRNLRWSTELSATDGSGGGPFSFEVVEPMQIWRIRLRPNAIGLELDLEWRARAPAWFDRVTVDNVSGTTAFDHLFQSGRYTGLVRVDGVDHSADGWWGQRDRSRGVRTMSGGQGLHLWFQAQFASYSVGLLLVETRDGGRVLLEGAVMSESGDVDVVSDVRHDLEFDDDLDLRRGVLAVTTAGGRRLVIDVDAGGRGALMAGGGYGGHHGRPQGRDHVEHDVYPFDGTCTPRSLDSSLTDRLATYLCDGQRGSGIIEFALTRSPTYTYRPTLA